MAEIRECSSSSESSDSEAETENGAMNYLFDSDSDGEFDGFDNKWRLDNFREVKLRTFRNDLKAGPTYGVPNED